jgi:hypothetical protein
MRCRMCPPGGPTPESGEFRSDRMRRGFLLGVVAVASIVAGCGGSPFGPIGPARPTEAGNLLFLLSGTSRRARGRFTP